MSAIHVERLDLQPDATSVRGARQFVVGVLRTWGLADLAEVSALITSELATNVVEHVGTPYAIVVAQVEEGVQIDVLDGGVSAPTVRQPGHDDPRGRGLGLVEHLARSWGATPAEARGGFAKGVRVLVAA